LKGTVLDITQRKIAEEKLLEEQHFIQKIANTTPNVITVFDLIEYKNIYFNKELHGLLGYSNEEFEKLKNDKDFLLNSIHQEDFQKCKEYIENFKSYLGNEPKELEYRLKDIEGNYRWILVRHNVFKRSENGLPIQIIGISRDITEKKAYELELLERESRLRESQSLAKMGHWELDLKTTEIYWSDGLYEIYGIERGTHLKLESVKKYNIDKDYDNLIGEIQKASQSKMPYTIEYRIIHPEHGLRTLFSRGAPVLNENNEVEKLKGITQDITERKTIEKELNESQKFIRAITESVPNIIFVYDVLNDKEIYSNRTLASTLGYTKAEAKAMGKNIMKTLVHPDDFGALQERNNNIISYGRKNKVFEVFYKIKHANGNWRWHRSLSKIFKYNSKGLPWQILGVTEDVTDRKLADDKLQKAYVDMQNMNLELAHAKGLLKESNNELEQRVEERTKELSDIINQLKNTAGEQQKFAALVEKSINFISMSDLEGNIIYLNDGGMKLVGLESKEEALQTRIKDYFFEKDHDLVYDKPFQSIGNWQQWSGEFYLKHFKTGEPIPVFSNAFRIEDPATGEILALANVSHDLTDHKKKEEEIRSSREKLEKK
ncbi:MAG: PAS domain S-box protein, partial [Bacteroidota bacterium]|nr:PAS domain S-box protein [Bacteroidota bacterium]